MWLKSFFLILVIFLSDVLGESDSSADSHGTSNLPFRDELEQVASEFREKLRRELSLLEMDMYNEFLNLNQDIDGNRRNLTDALTAELTKKVSDVMGKFNKVMTYSTERTQELNNQMRTLTFTLGDWVEYGVDPVGFRRRRRRNVQSRKLQPDDGDDGTKRQASSVSSEVNSFLQDVSEVNKLLTLDPEDFPDLGDIEDIDKLLKNSHYFDGDWENLDEDFTLREFSPETKSTYVLNMEKSEDSLEFVHAKEVLPRNCYDLLQKGNTQNGIYVIYPSGKEERTEEVWCDQETDRGGWTRIINRRTTSDQILNFNTSTVQYVHGFGIPSDNHWIGLEVMQDLTGGMSHALRVQLEDRGGKEGYATYGIFRVGSIDEDYKLEVGAYDDRSTAGDALTDHSGQQFVFPLPESGEGCSHTLGVGWWFMEEPLCYMALATGQFQQTSEEEALPGLEWTPWTESGHQLQSLSFMIRPSNA